VQRAGGGGKRFGANGSSLGTRLALLAKTAGERGAYAAEGENTPHSGKRVAMERAI